MESNSVNEKTRLSIPIISAVLIIGTVATASFSFATKVAEINSRIDKQDEKIQAIVETQNSNSVSYLELSRDLADLKTQIAVANSNIAWLKSYFEEREIER